MKTRHKTKQISWSAGKREYGKLVAFLEIGTIFLGVWQGKLMKSWIAFKTIENSSERD